MTPTRWNRIKDLFEQATTHPPEERDAFLDEQCGGDKTLKLEVRSLLKNDRDDNFIEPPDLGEVAHIFEDAETASLVGRLVGPYRLVRLIDSGGMGHVYLGERADGEFEKQVAIKIMRHNHCSPELVKRFGRERSTLAGLDHPNIAKLMDGGTTADGLSYLVMEYVEGRPIDEYCVGVRLDTSQRLELFRKVCGAVHYAHQRLVVHRDLKPRNILVTPEGAPKLLDFGIAKLLDNDSHHAAAQGATVPFLTPRYASPEQVAGDAITTASDVYSLGVILFELLTGRSPYRVKTRSNHEMTRVIWEQEPIFPSATLRRSSEDQLSLTSTRMPTKAQIAESRRTEPDALQRRLTGDLDNITMMALQKEPQRRYGSAEQFAEDIRCHLVGLPVIARRSTLSYRAAKFIKRNRASVIAATVLALTFIGGIIGTSVALIRVNAAQKKSRLMNEFLQDVLADTDIAVVGKDLTMRQVLDRAADRVGKKFQQHPEVEASLRSTIGKAYRGLRSLEPAEEQLKRSLELHIEQYGEHNLEVAESLHELSVLLHIKGTNDEAEELSRKSLKIRRSLIRKDDESVASLISDIGVIVKSQGDYDRAEPLYREALELSQRLFGPEHHDVASKLNNLAVLLKVQGRFKESHPLFERALDILRTNFGDDHFLTANTINNLANLRHAMGDYQGALDLLRQALEINRRLLSPSHPRIAIAANNLAALLQTLGEYDAAETLFRESLEINETQLGAEHHRTATSLHNLARLLLIQRRLEEAEQRCRRGLAIRRELLGDSHPYFATSLDGLGHIMMVKGEFAEAKQALHEAYETRKRIYPEGHSEVLSSLEHLTEYALKTGHPDKALSYGREAVSMSRRLFDRPDAFIATAERLLGVVLSEMKEFEEAEPLLRTALQEGRQMLGPSHPFVAKTLCDIARNLLAQGKPELAEPLILKAVEIERSRFPDGHQRLQASEILLDDVRASARTAANRHSRDIPQGF